MAVIEGHYYFQHSLRYFSHDLHHSPNFRFLCTGWLESGKSHTGRFHKFAQVMKVNKNYTGPIHVRKRRTQVPWSTMHTDPRFRKTCTTSCLIKQHKYLFLCCTPAQWIRPQTPGHMTVPMVLYSFIAACCIRLINYSLVNIDIDGEAT